MTKQTNECVPLPKGSYAIAHVQKTYCTMHTGTQHYTRFYVVRVESADSDGRVKTYSEYAGGVPKAKDRFTTIHSLGAQYLPAAAALYARQEPCFVGYRDKEHLRLCLVNQQISEAA